MLALWIALGAVITLVLLLVGVLVVQSARGRRASGESEAVLTLDPGAPVATSRPALIGVELADLDRALTQIRSDLALVSNPAPAPAPVGTVERQRSVDAVFFADPPTEEIRKSVDGLGEGLAADLEEARQALFAARGRWAGLDRQPLDRRADQARGVLAEADLLVGRLLAAQSAQLRFAVLQIRRALAAGDPAAETIAEAALADVRRGERLSGLRREVDEVLENLDLTTRADRVLHPRLAREREGTNGVRARVADRPWISATDLALERVRASNV